MEKILIIDDSRLQAQALKNILINDYLIETSQTGADGIEKAVTWNPSLILLDIVMPVMNGFEILARLRADENCKNIPVIMITSLSDVGNEEKGLTLGAVDYIIKPFTAGIVKARVNTHIQLYQYRKTIESLAMLDGLTGIPNRRYYDEQSKREWQRAMRKGTHLSVALLDIDFFKQYNDRYGHPSGDAAIKIVAQTLKGCLRDRNDFAARYGGEEFVFIMPETPAKRGLELAQQICDEVRNQHIPHADSKISEYLTVSIGGMTVIPKENDDFSSYFKIVDAMLYNAKKKGRNTVIWAQ